MREYEQSPRRRSRLRAQNRRRLRKVGRLPVDGAGRMNGMGAHNGGHPEAPGRRWRRFLFIFLPLAALVIAAAVFLGLLFQPFHGDPKGERVSVTIQKGSGVEEIAAALAEKGIVSDGTLFKLRIALSGEKSKLKSGKYRLPQGLSYAAAIDALVAGPVIHTVNVTIPEGATRGQIAPIARKAGLKGSYAEASAKSKRLSPAKYGAPADATLEGFLFPSTYELRRRANVTKLVDKQLGEFKEEFAHVDLGYAKSRNLTAFDVVVIASMIEREASVAKERKLVAGVIYNRMRIGLPLGIDATVRYAVDNWDRPLTESELATPSPYNTRVEVGLPPGPIGNPGIESLKAAAAPAKTDYLYYVVKPGTCGEHAFSSTEAQFRIDEERYNAARDAAGGKSPTKCD